MASLFEELWGEDIPRSANTTVQTYILHLRNLIGSALGSSTEAARQAASSGVRRLRQKELP